MKKIFIFAILLLAFAACATDSPPQIIGIPRAQVVRDAVAEEVTPETPQEFTVFLMRENAEFAKYEPSEGAYLAAWLAPENPIRMFEHQMQKRHAVYVNEMDLGDEIPVSWLLHCIASFATPLLIIHPPTDEELEDIPAADLVVYLAQRLGGFNLPMFIAFFPENHGMTPAEYTLFFRLARNAFLTHAPHAAFVWVAPSHAATANNPFYPGHGAVDWVALPLFANWTPQTEFTDVLASFEQFYFSFHEYKPIMILPLGVSHFTRGDFAYRLNPAAEELARLYTSLQNFPRLGLVAYADAFSLLRAYSDDFSVSIEATLTNAYRAAISPEIFLSELQRAPNSSYRWQRLVHHGYFYENKIFISAETLENELNISLPRQLSEINGSFFADSEKISEKKINVCLSRRVIFVETAP